MDELMNQIDNIKESITDQQYKELCDKMKNLFEERTTPATERFFRISYLVVVTVPCEEEVGLALGYNIQTKHAIVQLPDDRFDDIRVNIAETGICYQGLISIRREETISIWPACLTAYLNCDCETKEARFCTVPPARHDWVPIIKIDPVV